MEKSSQEYPVNAGVSQGFILGPTLFGLFINDLPDYIICDIAINADDTALYSECDQVSDLWQQLELASELESDLRDSIDWDRKWFVECWKNSRHLGLLEPHFLPALNPWFIVIMYPSLVFSMGMTLVDIQLNRLNWLVHFSHSRGRSTRYSNRLHDFSDTIT